MKLHHILPLLFSAFLISSFCFSGSGCASGPLKTYKAVSLAYVSVDSAMELWGWHVGTVVKGTDEAAKTRLIKQEQQVRTAYEAYQLASVAAIDAAVWYQDHPEAKLDFETASALYAVARDELLSLIKLFAPKLQLN